MGLDHLASEPERARRNLWTAFLLFRWVSIVWMIVLAASGDPAVSQPAVVWGVIGVTVVWNAWFTFSPDRERLPALWADLALSLALIVIPAVVTERAQIGASPSFSTFYKWSAPMAWGASRGLWAGIGAGAVSALAYVLTRPLNGVALTDLTAGQGQDMTTTVIILVAVGATLGAVARMQERSSRQLRVALDQALFERERAARLQEREKLARQIHDSVLQALALVHKRGRELAMMERIPHSEIARLAELAGSQEEALRSVFLRQPGMEPKGSASLRAGLEGLARVVPDVPITVSTVGPVWMSAPAVDEVLAAARQALENVARHAEASKASVFAEEEDGTVVVAIRDDGRGFSYDEDAFRASGKLGILGSIKGRIEDLGGTVSVDTGPGRGTRIEFRIPVVEP